MYFAVALSRRLSQASMQVYISAVGSLHRQHGMSDPTQQNTLLRLVLRGARRTYAINTSHVRQPITLPILVKLLYSIKRSPLPKWDKNMLAAAFTLAFYGLLRISEFSAPSTAKFDPHIHPTNTDIHWHKPYFVYNLRRSKTDQLQLGHKVYIHQVDNSTCPYSAMQRYFSQARLYSHKQVKPLFIFCNGDTLNRKNFLKQLRSMLKQAKLPSHHFNTHSFRIGAATSAAASGISSKTIKQLGRWKSNAYKLYTRSHNPHLKEAAIKLASAGNTHRR